MFYTYLSYESRPFGRSYIGMRECPHNLTPETDSYLGSYTDKTFKPNKKVILGKFSCLEFALEHEIELHNKYNVDVWDVFANRAKQTSSKFSFRGSGEKNPRFGKIGVYSHSQQTKDRIRLANLGENNYWYGRTWREGTHPMLGRIHSKETREIMSKNRKGKYTGAENPFYGKTHTQECRDTISEKLKGRFSGELNPFYGKNHSETTKNKMRGPRPSITGSNHPKYKAVCWFHEQYGEFFCSATDLRKMFPELASSSLSNLLNNKRKTPYKGWTIKV
jgi:hypothetical protein